MKRQMVAAVLATVCALGAAQGAAAHHLPESTACAAGTVPGFFLSSGAVGISARECRLAPAATGGYMAGGDWAIVIRRGSHRIVLSDDTAPACQTAVFRPGDEVIGRREGPVGFVVLAAAGGAGQRCPG